jgi:hypothetical protein
MLGALTLLHVLFILLPSVLLFMDSKPHIYTSTGICNLHLALRITGFENFVYHPEI